MNRAPTSRLERGFSFLVLHDFIEHKETTRQAVLYCRIIMSSDKDTLQATLGKLLGFDDGSEDVLEHLLSIESKDVRIRNASITDSKQQNENML